MIGQTKLSVGKLQPSSEPLAVLAVKFVILEDGGCLISHPPNAFRDKIQSPCLKFVNTENEATKEPEKVSWRMHHGECNQLEDPNPPAHFLVEPFTNVRASASVCHIPVKRIAIRQTQALSQNG